MGKLSTRILLILMSFMPVQITLGKAPMYSADEHCLPLDLVNVDLTIDIIWIKKGV